MIDTYFDRADRATGYHLLTRTPLPDITDDPRYWGGQLYATVADRTVAKARAMVRFTVAAAARDHLAEMSCGILLGTQHSAFDGAGRRKGRA